MQLSGIRGGKPGVAMDFFQGNYWNLLALILALGAIATALLQLINDLFPVRAVSHTFLLQRWIEKRARMYKTAGGTSSSSSSSRSARNDDDARKYEAPRKDDAPPEGEARPGQTPPVNTEEALAQLIAHATGGHWRALLGLPPAQLVAQINAAAQGALENPKANYSLIAVLSQPTDSRILGVLKSGQVATRVPSHIEELSILLKPPPQPPRDTEPGGKAMKGYQRRTKNYVEARTRVVHRIQRNLDGMQITLGNSSALITQILAILISIVFCSWIEFANLVSGKTHVVGILLVGISAGYVAPILGDIVAAIHRLGRAS